jgi:periplasmic divalent cation tolerance protein
VWRIQLWNDYITARGECQKSSRQQNHVTIWRTIPGCEVTVGEELIIALVTVSDAETGARLGRQLVEERLAACVQILPGGTAIYRWAGEIHADPQTQLLIKTARGRWAELRDRIVALHADEVPEILALPVVDGLPAYLSWAAESTAS